MLRFLIILPIAAALVLGAVYALSGVLPFDEPVETAPVRVIDPAFSPIERVDLADCGRFYAAWACESERLRRDALEACATTGPNGRSCEAASGFGFGAPQGIDHSPVDHGCWLAWTNRVRFPSILHPWQANPELLTESGLEIAIRYSFDAQGRASEVGFLDEQPRLAPFQQAMEDAVRAAPCVEGAGESYERILIFKMEP